MINNAEWDSSQVMSKNNFEIRYHRQFTLPTVNLHSHDFIEIYLFLNGNTSYIVENGKYELLPNDIIIIPPHISYTNQ